MEKTIERLGGLMENIPTQAQATSVPKFQSLLTDEVPNVRAAAAAAVSQALVSFWEAIPAATSKVLLTTLATSLASDKSSVMVRVAAVDALTALLEVGRACYPTACSALLRSDPGAEPWRRTLTPLSQH